MRPALSALALGIAAMFAPLAADAQALPALNLDGSSGIPELTLTLSPQYPQPYGTLTITPESTLLNLNNANVSIAVNGANIPLSADGSVTITLPGPGVETSIRAVATVLGQSYSASASITPGAVALVEEPIASAPALYPGKPLVPEGGSVRIVALPDFESSPGRIIAASALSYSWSVDGLASNALSGIGKQAIVVDAPLLYRTRQVAVGIQSQDGTVAGGASLTLTSQAPTLRLYADDPLEGILFDNALSGSLSLSGSEATLAAVPYSFTTDNGAPSINWFLNGSQTQSGSTITLRPTGQGSGTANLTASAAAASGQASAAQTLSISFGSSGNSSFLGL